MLLGLALLSSGCPQPTNVTYSLSNTVDLLAPSFYAGAASDGSNVAGRQAFVGQSSHDGETVAFWAVNTATKHFSFFLVDVDDPTSYRRITPDYYDAHPNTAICWTPDDSAILVSAFRIEIPAPGALSGLESWPIHGVVPSDVSTTALSHGNWEIAQHRNGDSIQIVALPILSDGSEDPWRLPIFLTDFADGTLDPDWVAVSWDCKRVAFADMQSDDCGVEPDVANVYVLKNIDDILDAPHKPGTNISVFAPTHASDGNLEPIRVSDSAQFAEAPAFSQDGKLVLYCQDFNNLFNDDFFYETLSLSGFDLMISNANGSGEDFRIALPGNQVFPSSIPGTSRIVYSGTSGGAMHLFAATLETSP
jgi:hypothetical protein